ncbi:MAG: metallophosphoesterase [Christensenellales bacterium]
MIQLRALVISDQESNFIWDFFDRSHFQSIDVIISCGDLKASYLSFVTTMVAAPLLYVPGNHDSHYLTQPPEGCEDLTCRMVTLKGVRFLGFGGANSRSPLPFHYSEKDVTRQITKRMPEICSNGGFDVLVTHTPAFGLGDGEDSFHKGFLSYRALLDQFTPRYHLHGHQHLSYPGAREQMVHKGTSIINAYGYKVIDLHFNPAARSKRLSLIKTRYDWGKVYAGQLRA